MQKKCVIYILLVPPADGTCDANFDANYCDNTLCELGEGDCDNDSECAGDLVCNNQLNNCGCGTANGWHIDADCCMGKTRPFCFFF